MPLEYLKPKRRREPRERAEKVPAKAGTPYPEGKGVRVAPADRMMRAEMVHDRRVTKQTLRRCVAYNDECWPASSVPACEGE